MRKKRKIVAAILAMFCLASCNYKSQRMPITVMPWYNSEPITIQVGKFSDMLRNDDISKLQVVADSVQAEIDRTPIEALYVLAIRLYDVGQKDDAVYWFYTAQFRRNIYAQMLEDAGDVGDAAFEAEKAQLAFNKLSGKWINGYAGGVPEKWIKIIEQVVKEGQQCGYIGLAYPELTFKPATMQAEIAKEIAGNLSELRQYIIDNREEIEHSRKENGIDRKS